MVNWSVRSGPPFGNVNWLVVIPPPVTDPLKDESSRRVSVSGLALSQSLRGPGFGNRPAVPMPLNGRTPDEPDWMASAGDCRPVTVRAGDPLSACGPLWIAKAAVTDSLTVVVDVIDCAARQ